MPHYSESPLVVHPSVLTVGSAGCKYTTLAAAITDAGSGDEIHVFDDCAENVTMPNNSAMILHNMAAVGTGAGPAITVAAAESCSISGHGTLTGVASLAAGAGGMIRLTSSVQVLGTTTGLTEIEGTIVVQSGEAIPAATGYAAGQRLLDLNLERYLVAETVGAALDWVPNDAQDANSYSVGAVGCDYTTLAGAVAVAVAGDEIHVYDSMAESPTIATGVTVVLHGGAVITAITVAAAVGAVVYVEGVGTITTCTAGIGAHVALGGGVTVTTQSGMIRRGRIWYLPTGQAVATYCPADASVVPIAVGDQLIAVDYPESIWTARTADAAVRWAGGTRSDGQLGSVATSVVALAASGGIIRQGQATQASKMWLISIWWGSQVATTNEAGKTWTIDAKDTAGNILLATTLVADTPNSLYNHRTNIDQVFATLVDASVMTTGINPVYGTKIGTPGNLTVYMATYEWAPVLE